MGEATDVNSEPTSDEVRKATAALLRDVDLETTTKRQIRALVEEKLGLTPGHLSEHAERRKLVGDTIEKAIVEASETEPPPEKATKTDRKRKKENPPKSQQPSKSQKKDNAPAVNADEAQIKQLKQQLLACGVRRVWAKELAGLPEPREQIHHLKGLLTGVGLNGRFSQAKAKQIKLERELRAEVEDIQKYQSPPEVEKEETVQSPSTAAATAGALDVDFLGDQSSSSGLLARSASQLNPMAAATNPARLKNALLDKERASSSVLSAKMIFRRFGSAMRKILPTNLKPTNT